MKLLIALNVPSSSIICTILYNPNSDMYIYTVPNYYQYLTENISNTFTPFEIIHYW